MIMVFGILSPFILRGQMLDQGNFLIGATLGFSSADSKISQTIGSVDAEGKGPSSLQVSFAPNIGYFVADNIAVGIGMSYTFSSLKEPNEDHTDDADLLFGPFGRYYFPLENNMAAFLSADFAFGNSSDEQFVGQTKQSIRTNIFAVGVGPGFTIYSDSGIGIEALFKYNFARSRFNTDLDGINSETITKTNQFDISLGIQFYFGGLQKVSGGASKSPF